LVKKNKVALFIIIIKDKAMRNNINLDIKNMYIKEGSFERYNVSHKRKKLISELA